MTIMSIMHTAMYLILAIACLLTQLGLLFTHCQLYMDMCDTHGLANDECTLCFVIISPKRH